MKSGMCREVWSLVLCLACISATFSKSVLPRQWVPSSLKGGGRITTSKIPLASKNKGTKPHEQEQLYEAYNMLHSLAQDFQKPFDAPAVLVVGHQTSGKSALIEGLMGFQFNHVGGGTKTRRPIALRMQYNASCDVPRCFLTLESGVEELKSLADIQAYIENENIKLERDPNKSFDTREISIRVEYRHCPNMILIDTPGLILAPKGDNLSTSQRALALASREAEDLVLEKMKCKDYIILCVEDTADWKHATTRNVVMQVDPTLSRTVLVTTKLDTKLTQFSEGGDVESFIRAPLIDKLYPQLFGGPFYTSVPSGRVGVDKDLKSNDEFIHSIKSAEQADKNQIKLKLKELLPSMSSLSSFVRNVGISKLRVFLENRVDESYRRNVATIVPQLEEEYSRTQEKLAITNQEIASLSVDSLRSAASVYRESFSKELSDVVHGSAKVSPSIWGETLNSEQLAGGAFLDTSASAAERDAWKNIVATEVGNAQHKLFGGAQYHRALREFNAAVKHMRGVVITEEEIANAAGVGDRHDGVNFMRAACVLALNKAESTFEPMLEALQHRCTHIMTRLFPLVDNLITDDMNRKAMKLAVSPYSKSTAFKTVVQQIYNKFISDQMDRCLEKCRDDLRGMTRFVTWDSNSKGGAPSSSLYDSLPTPRSMVDIYNVAVKSQEEEMKKEQERQKQPPRGGIWRWGATGGAGGRQEVAVPDEALVLENRIVKQWRQANGEENVLEAEQSAGGGQLNAASRVAGGGLEVFTRYNLLQMMDEMVSTRSETRTSAVISSLVQHIIRTWREHFARSVSQKFNCFFLLPIIDDFPGYLRTELDKIYASGADGGVEELFEMTDLRTNLLAVRDDLMAECSANADLRSRFDKINAQMSKGGGGGLVHSIPLSSRR